MRAQGHVQHVDHAGPLQQSPLMQLPAELRRQIYAYVVPAQAHLYRDRNTLCAATCITPRPSSDYYCFDRRSLGDPSTAVWARRLTSSWGGHWRCEEVAKRLYRDGADTHMHHDSVIALMASCRQIYEEVACLLTETCVIHVNDAATLDLLFRNRDNISRHLSTNPGHLLARAFFRVRRLDVALRLQLPIFKAIGDGFSLKEAATSSPSPPSPRSAWASLCRSITTLQHLQHVDVTLDHDSESSWSTVNEHAILAPLKPLASHPSITTTIHLPKVAPAWCRDFAPCGLAIRRFTRQRFFAEYREDGSVGIVYEEDACKSFHRPGPGADEMRRAADMIMHIWYQGVDMDYVAMDELSDIDGDSGLVTL